MHRHLYRHMDGYQRVAFCALASVLLSVIITAALATVVEL